MTEPEDDFAAMFEASLQAKRLEKGDLVDGIIVAIGDEVAFVDVGGKGEATIDIAELKNADGQIEVAAGDHIQAMVVSTSGGLTLSRRLAGAAATDGQLQDAFDTGLPVEGKVERAVKGGYEVRVGRQRAFCPISQIGLRGEDASAHDGQVYQFRIIEFKDGGFEPGRLAARPPRTGTAGQVRRGPGVDCPGRGPDGPRDVGARLRRLRRSRRRRPGTPPHIRDGVVARGRRRADRQGG